MVNNNHSGETRCERLLREALTAARLPFAQEAEIGPFHVDFLVGGRVCVEVDGFSHLACDAKARDAHKGDRLVSLGYTVLRISNSDVRSKQQLRAFIETVRLQLRREEALVKPSAELRGNPLDTPGLSALRDQLLLKEREEAQKPPSDGDLFLAAVDKLGPAKRGPRRR